MDAVERLKEYISVDFDTIMMKIKNGTIKCGKYAKRIKVSNNDKLGKELFTDGRSGKNR